MWHAIFPVIAYVWLLAASIHLIVNPEQALYLVAGVVLFLLFVGIHNAWDAALYIALNPSES